eukprot:3298602-Prorocentrum_lima.AAC.1
MGPTLLKRNLSMTMNHVMIFPIIDSLVLPIKLEGSFNTMKVIMMWIIYEGVINHQVTRLTLAK